MAEFTKSLQKKQNNIKVATNKLANKNMLFYLFIECKLKMKKQEYIISFSPLQFSQELQSIISLTK